MASNGVVTPQVSVFLVSWLLVAVVLLVGIFDVWVSLTPGQTTVSEYLSDLSRRYPVLPFILGMVAGHLFWGQK
jgi:hypothetical protein